MQRRQSAKRTGREELTDGKVHWDGEWVPFTISIMDQVADRLFTLGIIKAGKDIESCQKRLKRLREKKKEANVIFQQWKCIQH